MQKIIFKIDEFSAIGSNAQYPDMFFEEILPHE